jgi:hypothetical protein
MVFHPVFITPARIFFIFPTRIILPQKGQLPIFN